MSFSVAHIFKNGVKKKKEYARQTATQLPTKSEVTGYTGDNKGQPFPTLASMIQAKYTPDPSPTSSASSQSRPTSITAVPAVSLEAEELEDNSFYRYARTHFNLLFSRSAVMCVPHSKSLEGMLLTKDLVEAHLYNLSPYYREQYQAANGKVIMIEHPIVSTVSGYKESRTAYIISEEWVYIARKKIRVILIEQPLEGDPLEQLPQSTNTMSIPSMRCFKADLNFLTMFPENAEALRELQHSVQKFIDTYVYIRGFNTYTVGKIQNMYIRAHKTILEKNKLLHETCRIQTEYDHYLELVENVVMGLLHEKIWVHSLRSILYSQDTYLESICRAYAKESIALSRYAVSHPIADMSLHSFDAALTCLRRVDPDVDSPMTSYSGQNREQQATGPSLDPPAITPLEKLACLRSTLDLISASVTNYVKANHIDDVCDASPVTTDEMIPLLAYILVHSHIYRIASLAFYMEHFRLSLSKRSDHSFVLVTLKSAIEFLKGDPLGLHDGSSGISTQSTVSTSSAALSPKLQGLRARSTSFGSPMPASSPSGNELHCRSVSLSSQPTTGTHKFHPLGSPISLSVGKKTSELRHRKSQSADLRNVADALPRDHQQGYFFQDEYESSSSSSSRRNSFTPTVSIRPPIVLPSPRELNRRSLDIPNDWMLHGKHRPLPVTQSIPNGTVIPTGRPVSTTTSPKPNPITHLRPVVSTTFPDISSCCLPSANPMTNRSDAPDLFTVQSDVNATWMPGHQGRDHKDKRTATMDTRKLARSLSSRSSLHSSKLAHPPEIIHIRDGTRRPASISIDPRSMHRDEEDMNDLMGDFLRGLQSLDGDVIGERGGSYRFVRHL